MLAENIMAENCKTCKGFCGGKGKETIVQGLWKNNPLSVQILGVCSALAVTSNLANSIVMSIALTIVCVGTNVIVSLLRGIIPRRIRMIAEVVIIATFVIIFDQYLKAYYFDMSRQLGPYVGLIITNCIIMGRAETFALHNPPSISALDGLANGLGYTAGLCLVGSVRELLGKGQLLGYNIFSSDWYEPNQLIAQAPGAFIALGCIIAIANFFGKKEK